MTLLIAVSVQNQLLTLTFKEKLNKELFKDRLIFATTAGSKGKFQKPCILNNTNHL